MIFVTQVARALTPVLRPIYVKWADGDGAMGRRARSWLLHHNARLLARHGAASMADFDARLARLGPADVVLDLGANLGIFTEKLAATGAEVHAFEPDPHCFAKLSARFADRPNVHLHAKAISDKVGEVFLRRTRNFASNPDLQSTSSTILANGPQYEDSPSLRVEVAAFSDFVRSLGRKVALVKMDVEGAEFPILDQILDDQAKGIVLPIGKIFVETHERSFPDRIGFVDRLRRLRDLPYPIDTYWP